MLRQRQNIGIQAAKQEAAIGLEPRNLCQVVRAVLVERFRISRTARVLHRQQFASIAEGPAMERAGVAGLVTPLVAAQHRAAMAAGIDEGVQFAGLAAGNKDRLAANEGGEVVVRTRDLAFMGEINPVALEDVPHLQLEQRRIREDIAANPVEAGLRIVLQCGINGGLDSVQHVSLLAWFIFAIRRRMRRPSAWEPIPERSVVLRGGQVTSSRAANPRLNWWQPYPGGIVWNRGNSAISWLWRASGTSPVPRRNCTSPSRRSAGRSSSLRMNSASRCSTGVAARSP